MSSYKFSAEQRLNCDITSRDRTKITLLRFLISFGKTQYLKILITIDYYLTIIIEFKVREMILNILKNHHNSY